jgi:hypothetical protein
MSWLGWTLLVAACGSTTLLFAWCLVRVLRDPGERDRVHAAVDVDGPDREP